MLRIVDLYSTGGSLIQVFKCCSSKVDDIPEENSDVLDDEDDDVRDERHRVNKLSCTADKDSVSLQVKPGWIYGSQRRYRFLISIPVRDPLVFVLIKIFPVPT